MNMNIEPLNQTHKYFTRFQKKILSEVYFVIPVETTRIFIKQLINDIDNYVPGIKHHISIHPNIIMSVSIRIIDGDTFELKGKMRDLYSFLCNNSGLNLLSTIRSDYIEQIDSEQIDSEQIDSDKLNLEQFNKNTEPIIPKNLDDKCPTCCQSFRNNINVITKCGHTYHKHCILEWLTEKCVQPNCPICRTSFQ